MCDKLIIPPKGYFTPINPPEGNMNVKKLLTLLEQLNKRGYGDYDFTIAYDGGYGHCGIGKFKNIIHKSKTIEFDEEY